MPTEDKHLHPSRTTHSTLELAPYAQQHSAQQHPAPFSLSSIFNAVSDTKDTDQDDHKPSSSSEEDLSSEIAGYAMATTAVVVYISGLVVAAIAFPLPMAIVAGAVAGALLLGALAACVDTAIRNFFQKSSENGDHNDTLSSTGGEGHTLILAATPTNYRV